MTTMIEITAAKRALRRAMKWPWGGKHTSHWHGLPQGILGIGFGVKRTASKAAARDCIRVYVRQKQAKGKLPRKQVIGKYIDGYPTDVIPVAKVAGHAAPGGSIGNRQGVGGTLGCIVQDGAANYLLGSWHVMTNTYGDDGDPVYMPSLAIDGGAPVVGRLIATPEFHLNGGANAFDASVARIEAGANLATAIDGLGNMVLPSALATQNQAVLKQGTVTGRTSGVIDGIAEEITVFYNGDASQKALLTQQIAIVGDQGAFSSEGDSGAMVCTADLHPLGLIVGGSVTGYDVAVPHSFASPIQAILDFYQVSISVR